MVIGKFATISVGFVAILRGKPVRVLAIAQKVNARKVCLEIHFSVLEDKPTTLIVYGGPYCKTFRNKGELYETVMKVVNKNESEIVKVLCKESNH